MKKTKILIVLLTALLIGTVRFLIIPKFSTNHMIDSQSLMELTKAFNQAENNSYESSISKLLEELMISSFVNREGSDADQRPIFVNAQANFEQAIVYLLKSKQIVNCTCIIHTPAPATPLCGTGEISTGLIDPIVQNDRERLLTVKKRINIIHDYLQEGGKLFTVYPKKGRELRSPEQLRILDDLVQSYPNQLHAVELNCDIIPQDLVGATYFIAFADFSTYILSLRSCQAISPTNGTWAIWFGANYESVIEDRLQGVLSFLRNHGFHYPLSL
ncbi:hypothetical protein C10C_0142 [Chlamydia serpentis]|uniref:Uncharacterized protein n=1 Tax=Chlamydia serpentis TaxID=1967782 RepID=A0A2R8FAA2_9CHLA|nr:hypothetical protein [Chlamydia serpentis]SPN73324.1 hypothetical protein C10C_0142 [Chlamydia serpentis]